MKKSFLIIYMTLFVLVLLSIVNVSGQSESPVSSKTELEKLKGQLELIKSTDELVKIKIKGKKEENAKIKIIARQNVGVSSEQALKVKKTLPTIDFTKIDVSDEVIDTKIKNILLNSNVKCGSLNGVIISQIELSKDYVVIKDYSYTHQGKTIIVPQGFTYDRASIPKVLWSIIDKDSLGNVAPLLHDFLYRNGGRLPRNAVSPYKTFSRKETDKIFLKIMEQCGVDKVTRELAYQMVRKWGWIAWNYDKERQKVD